ncbi:hypothetical protein F5141DRAFT_645352 [Pisolithus sp. B1]|nr:hypothetical protein F5141DRAFT_645352 [Pisolithus sp. B1]
MTARSSNCTLASPVMRLLPFTFVGAVLASSVYLYSRKTSDNLQFLGNAPRITSRTFPEETARLCDNGSKRPSGACANYSLSLGRMASLDCALAGGDAYFCVLDGLAFCVKPKGNVVTTHMHNGECLRLGRPP